VTQYRQEEEIASFVQRADQAMYQSKQSGRNKVSCFFDTP
jgi:two-component system cell cycle response regulator